MEKEKKVKSKEKQFLNDLSNDIMNEKTRLKTSDINTNEKLKESKNNIITEFPSKNIIDENYKENMNNNNDNNNIIIEPLNNNSSIKSSLISKDNSDIIQKDKNEKILNIKNIYKNIEINEIIIKYLKYIIKDKIRRIIVFNRNRNGVNPDDKHKKICNINIKSYLKILKMISEKEKEDKETLIKNYELYIILLKNYFNKWKNSKNIKVKINKENKEDISSKDKNIIINKEEITILIKELIEKIIIIRNIYINLIIKSYNKNNKIEKNKILKKQNQLEQTKNEIEEIKNKLVIYFIKLNDENKEEFEKYIIYILIELQKMYTINEQNIEKYKKLYLIKKENKKKRKKVITCSCIKRSIIILWILMIPLFYIIYFLYSNGKINYN